MNKKLTLTPARVGKITFVNTIPFYFNLLTLSQSAFYVEGSPAEINELMFRGEIDFAPISSLEYALHQDRYLLLPDLCIGSRDFSRSVLLFSREKMEGLNGRTIVLSKKSFSSASLLKIILKFKYRFSNEFQIGSGSPGDMLKQADAVLAIGDEALFFKPKEFLYKYDLSELWWNWTELPFCFAVWAVRREFYEQYPREVFEFHHQLKRNIERNLQDLETLLKEALGLTVASEEFSRIFGYLFNLNYYLDSDMKKGLELFYRFAERAHLTDPIRPFEFIES